MDKPPHDAPEHLKARYWREEVLELTRDQLAALTGFSASSIKDFENPSKDIDPMARKRYRLACAAVAMGIQFDWLTTSLKIQQPVQITIGPDA
ncbi:helix-turn-helix domain-containing protein [Gellertiella hungarica]|uniref:Transcriptional regulator with XRE-family HTH domain n=1 Tax=Gellertiella hungarica TaxID=1572859 RepID=A0A7W6NLQ8_9HYPH|nr:helix-turn-helix transcriptional regulator [Gellertiella hungarica]MBB4066770.1 transcriptional regulator with XRE-family HTH domain [Gellertiella hungarica]